jgi:hypothetical protein
MAPTLQLDERPTVTECFACGATFPSHRDDCELKWLEYLWRCSPDPVDHASRLENLSRSETRYVRENWFRWCDGIGASEYVWQERDRLRWWEAKREWGNLWRLRVAARGIYVPLNLVGPTHRPPKKCLFGRSVFLKR